ncbi:hypothetical protein C2G38_194154 [Gigaspora rosea]|uniref:NAD(P)-binding protein n=1 Tax=Gigaspora rosea TaxID=44941 RepID=A0A397UT56_9GLOM|nr:hypothetical protein C2G38_194154 [Gigaspora rosea]
MSYNLQKRVVLITGASSGIGAAIALEFAKANSKLILLARRLDRLNDVKSKILETYPSCEIHISVVDIKNKQEIDNAIVNLPSGFKDIDVLVNNAGTAFGFDPLEENSQKDIQSTIETNVCGLIYMTQAVLPKMKERNSGDIINMGSISGKRSHGFGNAVYSGSKFAIEGITESLRKELLTTKIRVVLVRPGAVKSEFVLVRSYGNAEFSNAYYSGFEPLVPQDVAECVVFVAARPTNVVISEIEILPNAQADVQSLKIENSDYMKTLTEKYKK